MLNPNPSQELRLRAVAPPMRPLLPPVRPAPWTTLGITPPDGVLGTPHPWVRPFRTSGGIKIRLRVQSLEAGLAPSRRPFASGDEGSCPPPRDR